MSNRESFRCYASIHHDIRSCGGCAESRQCGILSELDKANEQIKFLKEQNTDLNNACIAKTKELDASQRDCDKRLIDLRVIGKDLARVTEEKDAARGDYLSKEEEAADLRSILRDQCRSICGLETDDEECGSDECVLMRARNLPVYEPDAPLDTHREETRALLREGKELRDEVISEFDGVTRAGTKPPLDTPESED